MKNTKKNLEKLIQKVNDFGNGTLIVTDTNSFFRKMQDGSKFETTKLTSLMMDYFDQAEAMAEAIGDDESELMFMNCQNPYY